MALPGQNRTLKTRPIVSLLLLIGILALPAVQGKKSKSPQEWAGHKINEVIEKFGSPTTIYDGGPQKVLLQMFCPNPAIDRPHDHDEGPVIPAGSLT